MPEKVYLGDGCYAQFDGYNVILTTENGISTTNEIYLEPALLAALDGYRKKIAEQYAAPQYAPRND